MYRKLSLPYAPVNSYWSDMEEEDCKISRRSLTQIEDNPPTISLEELDTYLYAGESVGAPTVGEFPSSLKKGEFEPPNKITIIEGGWRGIKNFQPTSRAEKEYAYLREVLARRHNK